MLEWKVGPKEADNEKLGALLLELRTRAGFSRATAAHRVEFSSEYLRLIERGVRTPVEGNLRLLLEMYKVDHTVEVGRVIIDDVSIEFTSRIKEMRRKRDAQASSPVLSRTDRLGRIVELLFLSDDETLRDVHTRLRRSRENHG